jgi:TonB family protein
MRRWFSVIALGLAALALSASSTPARSQTSAVEQQLRDRDQGKVFVLRGFYSDYHLRYDATGQPERATHGDWTTDGFVLVKDIQVSSDHLTIHGKRMLVVATDKGFAFGDAGDSKKLKKAEKDASSLKIEAEFVPGGSLFEQADLTLAKIFLTPDDKLSDLVPEYWKSCISDGLAGRNARCRFSEEIAAIPGIGPQETAIAESTSPASLTAPRQAMTPRLKSRTESSASPGSDGVYPIGHGVSPPRAIFSPAPNFSDPARGARYQGVATLMLVVDKEGHPTRLQIARPLGCGLDAKAVEAVSSWRFEPAHNEDGEPVAVRIAVEVDFHLY